ncbi:MAG: glycosyltransferase, partial [Bacteroidota bacterium]
MPKLVRITTIPLSLHTLLKGQMNFMKSEGFDVTMISSDGPEIKDIIESEKCRHITIPFTRKINLINDFISLVKLTLLLRKLKPEIVHTHTPKAGLIGMWAAKFANVPIRLHTIAGLPWMEAKGLMRKLLQMMEKLTAFAAIQIYPNSKQLHLFLQQQKIGIGKMRVLGNGSSNGIDCNYYNRNSEMQKQADELKRKTGINEEGLIWIFAGRIVKDKGVEELLDSFIVFQRDFPEDQLWLLGNEEPELDPLGEKYKQVLHTHQAIKSWGFCKDVRPYFAAADVLVFPSYREGFPNVP